MKPSTPIARSYTIYTYDRGNWRARNVQVKPATRPCTHEGPCRFPFKKCDGGICYAVDTD